MISVLIYRLFFRGGRHRGLYLLTMAAYYSVCFMLVSGPLAMLADLGEEALPPTPVDEVPLSDVTTASLRLRSVTDRWALRARVVERYCREDGATRTHRTGDRSILTSERHKLATCAASDTADHFWLRAFTRLARHDPSHRCAESHNDLSRCKDDARRLEALSDRDTGHASDAQWTRVVTVRHPYARLAAAYLRRPWPTASSTFSEAVSALNSGTLGLPDHAEPLTSTCGLCGHGSLVIIQAEMEDQELAELGRQRGIVEYLRRPASSPHSPARAAMAGQDSAVVSRLLQQLTADQLSQLQRLYQRDFNALAFYDPAEFEGREESPEKHHRATEEA